MVDRKPPRLAGDERETLLQSLQYQRDCMVRKVEGVPESSARQQFVDSGTTLLWLTKHVARAELLWVVQRFAGEGARLTDDGVNPDDTLHAAVDAYRRTWWRVDAIVATSSLDAHCRSVGEESMVNLRWVLVHLIEETARHAGHADIIRELIDGSTGR
jgi:Protein of unknown function (DUF664)